MLRPTRRTPTVGRRCRGRRGTGTRRWSSCYNYNQIMFCLHNLYFCSTFSLPDHPHALVERSDCQSEQGSNESSPLWLRRSTLVSFLHVAQASISTRFHGLEVSATRSAGVERGVARSKLRLPSLDSMQRLKAASRNCARFRES